MHVSGLERGQVFTGLRAKKVLELEQCKDSVCEVGGGIELFRGLNAPLSLQSRWVVV